MRDHDSNETLDGPPDGPPALVDAPAQGQVQEPAGTEQQSRPAEKPRRAPPSHERAVAWLAGRAERCTSWVARTVARCQTSATKTRVMMPPEAGEFCEDGAFDVAGRLVELWHQCRHKETEWDFGVEICVASDVGTQIRWRNKFLQLAECSHANILPVYDCWLSVNWVAIPHADNPDEFDLAQVAAEGRLPITLYLAAEMPFATLEQTVFDNVPGIVAVPRSVASLAGALRLVDTAAMHKIMYQLLRVLSFMEAKHLVHGCITGATVMVSAQGDIKLTDFGAHDVPTYLEHLVPMFRAPEAQDLSGLSDTSSSSSAYSLGDGGHSTAGDVFSAAVLLLGIASCTRISNRLLATVPVRVGQHNVRLMSVAELLVHCDWQRNNDICWTELLHRHWPAVFNQNSVFSSLIKCMLHPNPACRITAAEAFARMQLYEPGQFFQPQTVEGSSTFGNQPMPQPRELQHLVQFIGDASQPTIFVTPTDLRRIEELGSLVPDRAGTRAGKLVFGSSSRVAPTPGETERSEPIEHTAHDADILTPEAPRAPPAGLQQQTDAEELPPATDESEVPHTTSDTQFMMAHQIPTCVPVPEMEAFSQTMVELQHLYVDLDPMLPAPGTDDGKMEEPTSDRDTPIAAQASSLLLVLPASIEVFTMAVTAEHADPVPAMSDGVRQFYRRYSNHGTEGLAEAPTAEAVRSKHTAVMPKAVTSFLGWEALVYPAPSRISEQNWHESAAWWCVVEPLKLRQSIVTKNVLLSAAQWALFVAVVLYFIIQAAITATGRRAAFSVSNEMMVAAVIVSMLLTSVGASTVGLWMMRKLHKCATCNYPLLFVCVAAIAGAMSFQGLTRIPGIFSIVLLLWTLGKCWFAGDFIRHVARDIGHFPKVVEQALHIHDARGKLDSWSQKLLALQGVALLVAVVLLCQFVILIVGVLASGPAPKSIEDVVLVILFVWILNVPRHVLHYAVALRSVAQLRDGNEAARWWKYARLAVTKHFGKLVLVSFFTSIEPFWSYLRRTAHISRRALQCAACTTATVGTVDAATGTETGRNRAAAMVCLATILLIISELMQAIARVCGYLERRSCKLVMTFMAASKLGYWQISRRLASDADLADSDDDLVRRETNQPRHVAGFRTFLQTATHLCFLAGAGGWFTATVMAPGMEFHGFLVGFVVCRTVFEPLEAYLCTLWVGTFAWPAEIIIYHNQLSCVLFQNSVAARENLRQAVTARQKHESGLVAETMRARLGVAASV